MCQCTSPSPTFPTRTFSANVHLSQWTNCVLPIKLWWFFDIHRHGGISWIHERTDPKCLSQGESSLISCRSCRLRNYTSETQEHPTSDSGPVCLAAAEVSSRSKPKVGQCCHTFVVRSMLWMTGNTAGICCSSNGYRCQPCALSNMRSPWISFRQVISRYLVLPGRRQLPDTYRASSRVCFPIILNETLVRTVPKSPKQVWIQSLKSSTEASPLL